MRDVDEMRRVDRMRRKDIGRRESKKTLFFFFLNTRRYGLLSFVGMLKSPKREKKKKQASRAG